MMTTVACISINQIEWYRTHMNHHLHSIPLNYINHYVLIYWNWLGHPHSCLPDSVRVLSIRSNTPVVLMVNIEYLSWITQPYDTPSAQYVNVTVHTKPQREWSLLYVCSYWNWVEEFRHRTSPSRCQRIRQPCLDVTVHAHRHTGNCATGTSYIACSFNERMHRHSKNADDGE